MPFFSIIVPIYNTEKYLCRCIESILQQECTDFELILVNDGSSDSSPEICNMYASKDKRIQVLHKDNGGVSSARNLGLRHANGRYVWFVDSDDYIIRGALKELKKLILFQKKDLYVFNKKQSIIIDTDEFNSFLEDYYFKYRLGFEPWNKIYLRSIIKENCLEFDEEETIGEDLLFNMIYYRYMKNGICFIGENYYFYDERPGSAMNSKFSTRHIQQIRLYEKIINYCGEILNDKNQCVLFLMHLFSGINQSKYGKVSDEEYICFFRKNFKSYNFSTTVWKGAIKTFLDNEGATFKGKVRVKTIIFLCRKKMFRIAVKIL